MWVGDRRLFIRWVRASVYGWLVGFVLIVGLAIVWDLIGGGAQFMIGIGMGAGVGYFQGRLVKNWLGSARPWVLASTVGMGAPFVLGDLGGVVGMEMAYSLPLYAAIGGLIVGWWQGRLLHAHCDRPYWWVPASVVGWTLPVGLIALNDAGLLSEVVGVVAFLVAIVFGGVILGAATGGTLVRMLQTR